VKRVNEFNMPREPFRCIHDKDQWCGNYQSWEDFITWEGEKKCHITCPSQAHSQHRKRSSQESFAHNKRYPKGASVVKHFGSTRQRRAYQIRERGRQVA